MKSLVAKISILSFIFNTAYADCDWSKIKKNQDESYTYTKELHVCVGQMKEDLDTSNKKVETLNKALDLKDFALKMADDRAVMWMNTSLKLEEKVAKVDELSSKNQWLFFALGVAATAASAYVASRVLR